VFLALARRRNVLGEGLLAVTMALLGSGVSYVAGNVWDDNGELMSIHR